MSTTTPTWAMTRAGPGDYSRARDAQRLGRAQIKWPDQGALRTWARQQGWPAPRWGFPGKFTDTMLASEESFELAISQSGVEMSIPKREFLITAEKLGELDGLYAERSPEGRPSGWGMLVEDLRQIRRAVEAGVVVAIDGGPQLKTWQEFYSWAHGRYHALEDGYDHWIGDDAS